MLLKRLSLTFLLLLFILNANAQQYEQPETLTGDIHTKSGYGGPVFKYSRINEEDAILIGGYGGWFINNAVMIGFGGCGLASEILVPEEDRIDTTRVMSYEMGYGGLMLEFTVKSKKLIHFSFGCLIGGGGIGQSILDDYQANEISTGGGAYFVTEPFANLELNITRFFRIAAGGGYRYTLGSYTKGITDKDLNSFSGNLTFKFGWF